MSKIGAVVGSALWDLSLTAPRLPEAGETVLASGVHLTPGGKALNQAVALARLGAHVSLVSAIGQDALGRELRAFAVQEGVRDDALFDSANGSTGVGVPLQLTDGGKRGFAAPGASMLLDSRATAWLATHRHSVGWLLAHFETDPVVLQEMLSIARGNRMTVYMNCAPPNESFRTLVQSADFMVLNQAEAAWLFGEQIASPEDASVACERARLRYGATIIITLGAKGVCWSDSGGSGFFEGFAGPIVNTVGAGDAFCAGLVFAREELQRSLAGAIRLACACGVLACRSEGAAITMPMLPEVLALLGEA